MLVTLIASNQDMMLDDDGGSPRPRDGEPSDVPPDGQLDHGATDGVTNEPLPVSGEEADVGLAQKGTDEDAIVRGETDT